MSRQAELTTVGFTQASRVMAVVRCRLAESGILIFVFVPLKASALPYLPNTHVAFETVPELPLPEKSVTVVPVPSSNENAATSSGIVERVVTVTTFEYGPRLLAASSARTT